MTMRKPNTMLFKQKKSVNHRAGRPRRRLILELLEDRRLLDGSVRIWDGGGDDALWSTAANWVGDVTPSADDHLVFPTGATQTASVNDFTPGTAFGSILISGSNYNLTGGAIVLDGSITSEGTGNHFSIDVQLSSNGGFAQTVAGVFTLSGTLDLNGQDLTLDAVHGSGIMRADGNISGSGSLTTGGSGQTVLAGDNAYAGSTTIAGGTLVLRHDNALGVADGTAANGTFFNAGILRLENNITIGNERLTGGPNFSPVVRSVGVNTWGGNVTSTSSLSLQPSWGNTLIVAGNVNLPSWLYIQSGGRTVLEGQANTAGLVYVSGSGTVAEVNGALTTASVSTSNAVSSGATLTGTGTIHAGTSPGRCTSTARRGSIRVR
jgi:autotransporter-associated beta strand protein